MDKQEIIKRLEILNNSISEKNSLLKRLSEVEDAINSVNSSSNTKLNAFDLKYKNTFINEHVGERSVSLNKFNPLNYLKKKKSSKNKP